MVVLEAGRTTTTPTSTAPSWARYERMYLKGGGAASDDQSVGLLAGACLGGGTVVNYTTSFRTPDDVREEWAGHGVPAFLSDDYTASLDAVCERLGVNRENSTPSTRDATMQRGLHELGWHVDFMPRNVRGCDQGRSAATAATAAGSAAKQSTAKTWLVDAQKAGARIVVGTRAERVVVESGAARGVEARTADGHAITVRSRAVVAAAGAIHTPALLRRSGLENANIGKHLKLHPATAVWGVFDEELRPWEGVMQALYSDEHRYLDGGYGVKYETAANHPSIHISFSPWRGASHHDELMQALPNTMPIGVLLRDRDGGEVRVGKDGQPVVRYRLSEFDAKHMRAGVDGAAQILEAAGARRIFSSHSQVGVLRPRRRRRRRALYGGRRRGGLRSGPDQHGLVPHHGLGPHGRLAGHVGLQPERRDLGRPRPGCGRRLGLPVGLRRQPDDLHRGDRAHERQEAGGEAGLDE